MGVGAMRRMLLRACARICLPATAAVLTFWCDGTMKEEAQGKAHAITKMGLIVNSDAGVVTGFTGITAHIDEVNAKSVLFSGTTTHPSGAEPCSAGWPSSSASLSSPEPAPAATARRRRAYASVARLRSHPINAVRPWSASRRAPCRPSWPAPTASRSRPLAGWLRPALSRQARSAREGAEVNETWPLVRGIGGGLVNHWARRPLPRLDSEQFRPATGTWRSAGGRLRVRRTDYEGGSPRVRHTTARIRHLARRQCSGGVAARGARAAVGTFATTCHIAGGSCR